MPENIVIMIAMQGEAACLINKLSLKQDENTSLHTALNANVYQDNTQKIHLITFGKNSKFGVDTIGTQRAALLTWEAIQQYHPTTILNLGTAGGVAKAGAQIGDVYACTNAVYHDRRINLANFKQYGIGGFPCYAPESLKKIGLKFGTLTTGNALDTSPTDMQCILQSNAVVKDMEGAAIAEIAEQSGVQYTGIKSVTDIIDNPSHPTEDQFIKNFTLATNNLCAKSYDVTRLLLEKNQ